MLSILQVRGLFQRMIYFNMLPCKDYANFWKCTHMMNPFIMMVFFKKNCIHSNKENKSHGMEKCLSFLTFPQYFSKGRCCLQFLQQFIAFEGDFEQIVKCLKGFCRGRKLWKTLNPWVIQTILLSPDLFLFADWVLEGLWLLLVQNGNLEQEQQILNFWAQRAVDFGFAVSEENLKFDIIFLVLFKIVFGNLVEVIQRGDYPSFWIILIHLNDIFLITLRTVEFACKNSGRFIV